MAFNLKNRHFLKELDFTKEELVFLLKLSKDLKNAKYCGTEQQKLAGKNIALILKKIQPAHVVHLRLLLLTRVLMSHIWDPQAARWDTRKQ
jgi:hypothetical protein